MSYNLEELPKYFNTAGKITVVTALFGVVVFAIAFLLNLGANELQKVDAQGFATTTVTVLNTPPQWTVDAQESVESSTSSPTNSGDVLSWTATATDSNAEDYFLIICSTASVPTSTPGGPPTCNGGTQWAISGTTTSGTQATAATTTTEAAPFFPGEENDWYAWICDAVNPGARCNSSFRQGTGTTASPFNINRRPSFTAFSDNSEPTNAIPGDTVTFYGTSTDPDTVDTADTMQLIICSTSGYSTSTNTCDATTLATSTFSASNPLQATYTIFTPTPDGTFGAFGFVIDEHGHEATGGQQGVNTVLTVGNVAPTVLGGDIVLNNGGIITLSVEGGETTGFSLDFTVNDNNSCSTTAQTAEITDYEVTVFRGGIGTSTCDGTGANYDPNNCYDNGVATTTWNLQCTASSTSCTYDGVSDFDDDTLFECTFPLWYVADPTNGTSTQVFYFDETWSAGVAGADDDFATGSMATTSNPQELDAFLMFSLDTLAIPYGPLEPGQRTDPLAASTTLRATGNVGLDESLSGEHMCDTYTGAVTCAPSATSTIAAPFQVFATSTVAYGTASSAGNTLSSTTLKELELNILKPTSTATGTTEVTYWGIEVPGTITKSGLYTGENTIYGILGEPAQWY